MANTSDSIEELTASLQELAAYRKDKGCDEAVALPGILSPGELTLSQEVESFVQKNREYALQSRSVSVGIY
jgi:hypothetical protein